MAARSTISIAEVTAPVGIPLGNSGLILTSVEGGFLFGGNVLPSVDNPKDLITRPEFINPLTIDNGTIKLTDLPLAAQRKLTHRGELRAQLGRLGRRGRADVGNEVGNREIDLVANAGYQRQRVVDDRACQRLVVEAPQVFERTAAAHQQHQ